MSVGRPTKYEERFCEEVRDLCLLGATDDELAEHFGVARSTLSAWKNEFPDFSDAIKKAKRAADAVIAGKLYRRAEGYDYEEQQAFKVKVGPSEERVEVVEVQKHVPPDPTSMIFWLKNRQPHLWRDVKAQEVSGPGGGPLEVSRVELVAPTYDHS
jgi:transcriptional regulator with XRE-family HTH domain